MIKVNDEINFILYDSEDISHIKVLSNLLHDEDVTNRLGHLLKNIPLRNYAFLIEISEKIIGAINFSVENNICNVSYAVLKEERKKGYATMILKAIPSFVFKYYPTSTRVLTLIERDNTASINSSKKAGYSLYSDSSPYHISYCYPNPKVTN